jgi:hypothetical protein
MKTEPVAIVAGLTGLFELVLPVLLIFGVLNWTDAQVGTVMALIIGIGAVVGGFFARSKVSPVTDQ